MSETQTITRVLFHDRARAEDHAREVARYVDGQRLGIELDPIASIPNLDALDTIAKVAPHYGDRAVAANLAAAVSLSQMGRDEAANAALRAALHVLDWEV